MSRTFRTAKGTELPLMLLRGKEYLEVKYRLVWFREERPAWRIETELVSLQADSAVAKATIRDENGAILATAHKSEDKKGFADFMEKSETGAIGRALALLGYGTQFCADELDEGGRLVDAPVDAPKEKTQEKTATKPQQAAMNKPATKAVSARSAGEFEIKKAKKEWEGRTIKDVVDQVGLPAFQNDVRWWAEDSGRKSFTEIKALKQFSDAYAEELKRQNAEPPSDWKNEEWPS
jgi:hypothetical protein